MRRIHIQLNDASAAEFEAMRAATGETGAEIVRCALALLRLYIDETAAGNTFVIRSADREQRLLMPINVQKQ